MIRALITGSLYGPPQARTSQAGKQYVTAKVRADGKDGAVVWCSVIAFGEQADRLLTLGDGAALSVSGKAEINGWLDKQGEPRAGLSLVADDVATLKAKPKPQGPEQGEPRAGLSLVADDVATLKAKPKPQGPEQGEPAPRRSPRRPVATAPGFDDALPDCFS